MNRTVRAVLGRSLRQVYRRDVPFALHTLFDDDAFDYKTDLAEQLHADFRKHKAYANLMTMRDLHDELADLIEGVEGIQKVSFMNNHTYIAVAPSLVRSRWAQLLKERAVIVDLRSEPDARSELLIGVMRLLRKSELVKVDLSEAYRTYDFGQRQAIVADKLRPFADCRDQVEFVVNHRLFDLSLASGRVHHVFPSNLQLDRCSMLYLNKLSQGVSRTLEAKSTWAEELLRQLAVGAAEESEGLLKLVVKLYDDLLDVLRVDGSEVHAQVSRRAEQLRREGRWKCEDERLRGLTTRLLTEIL